MRAHTLKLHLLTILFLLGFTSVSAHAGLIQYTGTCDNSLGLAGPDACGDVGLADGEAISASFKVNLSGTDLLNATLDETNVLSFSVAIGTVSFTDADTSNWDLRAMINALGEVTSFEFLASLGSTTSNSPLGDSVDLRAGSQNGWFASESGRCGGSTPSPCDYDITTIFSFSPTAASGPGSARVVPEPASLALFGLGLAGLGWSRRKKA